MNTKTILSILFIITLFSAKAQINAGLGGTFSYPIKDFNGLTNYSLAGEIGLGYTFKQQIDVDIAYSHYLVNSNISNKHKIYAYSTNIKYYFTKTNIRPYINLGFGKYYMEYVDVFGFDIKKFDDFGINPGVKRLT
ncbi:MAG: hypothetical protein B6I20_04090 [Bacteroidetes bacterium 4572_117]|nr:MAG: hypothetical protein B6I20_04090 [Bacteroidetes bacterium 4572_117]